MTRTLWLQEQQTFWWPAGDPLGSSAPQRHKSPEEVAIVSKSGGFPGKAAEWYWMRQMSARGWGGRNSPGKCLLRRWFFLSQMSGEYKRILCLSDRGKVSPLVARQQRQDWSRENIRATFQTFMSPFHIVISLWFQLIHEVFFFSFLSPTLTVPSDFFCIEIKQVTDAHMWKEVHF